MKNKFWGLFLAIVMLASSALLLASCTDEEPIANEPTVDEPTTDNPTGEPEIPEDDPTTDDPTEDEPTVDEPEIPEDSPPIEDEPTEDEPTEDSPTEDSPTEDIPTEEPEIPGEAPEKPEDSPPTEDVPTEDEPTKEGEKLSVTLIENGKASFNFVLGQGYSADVRKAINDLISDLSKLGISVSLLEDTEESRETCEVLIGTVTSRGAEYEIPHYVYGYDGYEIKPISTKVSVGAGSESALLDAIKEFKKEILGISKKTVELTEVIVTEADTIKKSSEYPEKSITVNGILLDEYSIICENTDYNVLNAVVTLRDYLYKTLGYWLDILPADTECENKLTIITKPYYESVEKGFEIRVNKDGLTVECGFKNKLGEALITFITTEAIRATDSEINFTDGYIYDKIDVRNVYYEDFGAKGDGYTDDFFAIKSCHDYANLYGHTVNANKGAKYYIGNAYLSSRDYIEIKTDVCWEGAELIFDDSEITVERFAHRDSNIDGACDHCGKTDFSTDCKAMGAGWQKISVFRVVSDNPMENIMENLPEKSISKNATSIGFAPGKRVLVVLTNANIRQFIRYGVNADAGEPQTEIILVNPDGSIDENTPLHWDYTTLTSATAKATDDIPLTIKGGIITTIANQAPNYYTDYSRNIYIERSNTTLDGIVHYMTEEGPTRAPYNGFTRTEYTDNVTFKNMVFTCHAIRNDAGTGALLGSYETAAKFCNNVSWINCTQTNFFEEDGSVINKGLFGSSYCKNMHFDGCFMSSMDAHRGAYNVTIKNSTFQHMNFIGEGLLSIENVTVYADSNSSGIVLRGDYGSTWRGELNISGFDLRYESASWLQIIDAKWENHYFGYSTYMPHTVRLDKITTTKVSYELDSNGKRCETVISQNEMPIYFSKNLNAYTGADISDPDEQMQMYPTSDKVSCDCEGGINDTTGDGRCDNVGCGLVANGSKYSNRNPYAGTELLYITNSPGLIIVLPVTEQFANMLVFVDGVEVGWLSNGIVAVGK